MAINHIIQLILGIHLEWYVYIYSKYVGNTNKWINLFNSKYNNIIYLLYKSLYYEYNNLLITIFLKPN